MTNDARSERSGNKLDKRAANPRPGKAAFLFLAGDVPADQTQQPTGTPRKARPSTQGTTRRSWRRPPTGNQRRRRNAGTGRGSLSLSGGTLPPIMETTGNRLDAPNKEPGTKRRNLRRDVQTIRPPEPRRDQRQPEQTAEGVDRSRPPEPIANR